MAFLNLRTPVIRTGLLALFASLILTGCGGTKVYDSTKTIVYRDSIYQVTDVQQIKRSITGIKSDDSTVNMTNMERRQVEDLLDAEDSVFVRMKFDLDGQELLYRASNVESWGDFSRMKGDFDRAQKDIAKLMKEKKTAQLKLR